MDIHKPKPWHGWREFLKEYVIIVVGVLTALAGEQLVETIHRNTELAETREALREEIAHNAGIVAYGVARDVCGQARDKQLTVWANGGPKPGPTPTAGPNQLAFDAWDVAKAGPLGKMPVKDRLTYSRVYDTFVVQQLNLNNQINDGLDMVQYTSLDRLAPNQAQRLIELMNRMRVIRSTKALNAVAILSSVKAMGIQPTPVPEGARASLDDACRNAGIPTPTP